MMSPEQYAEAQQRLLIRSRCMQDDRLQLEIVKAEASRSTARLEQAIAEDQHQIEDLAIQIDAHWREVFHLPAVDA
jgi:hypothetical protein